MQSSKYYSVSFFFRLIFYLQLAPLPLAPGEAGLSQGASLFVQFSLVLEAPM